MRRNCDPHRFFILPSVFKRRSRALLFAKGIPVLDLVLIVLAAVLFVLTIGYAYACDRL